MEFIFDEIINAAPDATVIFMVAYNPFSLGLGTELEATTDATLTDFNQIAATIATDKGILIADAFTPMVRTTGSTTHMLDSEPDIHPVPIGYDILAGALLDALG
jgi:lysophospholipase L1-like esterase